ncbi:uncharacterized protein LOC143274863 isoform X2 [Babylonia areolata]|uniref:uncharacterized protein LOC143274863 isoform X2 n=1 Tax=Babylonia areolata TaxID=304850 RepID=UPI003FD3B554
MTCPTDMLMVNFWGYHGLGEMDAGIFIIDSRPTLPGFIISLVWGAFLREIKCEASVPVLVLANKQDMDGVTPWQDIVKLFSLEKLKGRRTVQLYPTSVTTGQGLPEALTWLHTQLQLQTLKTVFLRPLSYATQPLARRMALCLSSTARHVRRKVRSRGAQRQWPTHYRVPGSRWEMIVGSPDVVSSGGVSEDVVTPTAQGEDGEGDDVSTRQRDRPPEEEGDDVSTRQRDRPPEEEGDDVSTRQRDRPPEEEGDDVSTRQRDRPPEEEGDDVSTRQRDHPPEEECDDVSTR